MEIYELVKALLHSVQGKRLGNVAKNSPRSDDLLEDSQKAPQRGRNCELLQWMESAIIQTSNQKYKVLAKQKEGGKQGRSPSSFYQKATSHLTSPRRE
ncbi:hypothetical protein O181_117302 [Austropuccinia psidii MF-1]|uniref:Uncharacterized protein n=1 Tax=Austropuccinia psidii MF-1 TaxID=1389203 RepID=A0A9Q3KB00_9BASI|nr:hypothetical protein [Austropuccinia psidii MF-1]